MNDVYAGQSQSAVSAKPSSYVYSQVQQLASVVQMVEHLRMRAHVMADRCLGSASPKQQTESLNKTLISGSADGPIEQQAYRNQINLVGAALSEKLQALSDELDRLETFAG